MRKNLTVIFLIFLFSSIQSIALVDMKNANYTNTWIDLTVPGSGYDLKIARTYNSRSLFSGIFGFGWCSDFETKIEVTAEGNIKLTECGAGLEVWYYPREFDKKAIDRTVDQIVAKLKADKKDDNYIKKIKPQLIESSDLRSQYAALMKISIPVKEGSKYLANGREVETFTFNKTYYTRSLADGSSMRFDLNGRLTHLYDKGGNFLKLEYDKDLLREVSNNNGAKLNFKYHPNKKIQSINGPNGLKAEYKFANLDDLTWMKNAWNNVYAYEYDDLHNMKKSTYPDNTHIALTYDVKNDWVLSFKDRSNCLENYKYEVAAEDPKNHYWSTVKKVCDKQVVTESKFEFWYKERFDGQTYLHRVATTVNGSITDITYHETFGKPVISKKNNEKVSFEYTVRGQVKMKSTDFNKLVYSYDERTNKVSEVVTTFYNEKGKPVSTKSTQFKYDDKSNLTFAQNSDGQKINMTYDAKGRISTITDQAKKLVKIEYEERFGKPSIVTRPGLGSIKVTYKPNGEIQKVDSKEGPSVAVQVASAFNNLLDIIAPASAESFL